VKRATKTAESSEAEPKGELTRQANDEPTAGAPAEVNAELDREQDASRPPTPPPTQSPTPGATKLAIADLDHEPGWALPSAPSEEFRADPDLVPVNPSALGEDAATDPNLGPALRGLPALRAWLRSLPRRLGAWFLLRLVPAILAGLAAAIPVIHSTIRAVHEGWQPAGDDGIILTRALDVFTSHSPLIGQYSEAGTTTGQIVHSPGPMLYWLLAVPVRLGGPASSAIAMGIVNTLAIIGCVALARRRGGLVLMFAVAIGIALMCQSLSAEIFHDVWNPSAAMFPFLLLIFLCWSLACGEYRLLPAVVIVASFVVQTHLMYVAPTAGILAVGLGGLAVSRFALWRRARAKSTPRRRSFVAAWVFVAVVAFALCWSAPAIDQIEHDPGNLVLIARSVEDRGKTLGPAVGWNAVVEAIGINPWWLTDAKSTWSRKNDVRKTPSNTAIDSAIVILLGLWLIAVVAALRRRGDLVAASLMALAMCLALGANAANNPSNTLLAGTLGYTLWWGSQLGLWVWLTIAWTAWCALGWFVRRTWPLLVPLAHRATSRLATQRRATQRLTTSRRTTSRPLSKLPRGRIALIIAVLAAFAASLAATASVGEAIASKEHRDSHWLEYASIGVLSARIDALIPRGQTINYETGPLDTGTQPMEPAMRFTLTLHGDRVLSNGALPRLGPYYVLDHRSYQWAVLLTDSSAPEHGMTLASRVHFVDRGHQIVSLWARHVHHRQKHARTTKR
jgi:hypothetical protein